jgi:hypothetical protein
MAILSNLDVVPAMNRYHTLHFQSAQLAGLRELEVEEP